MWISQVTKQLSLAVTGATLVTLGIFFPTHAARAAILTNSLPEYNFDGEPTFPNPANLVGTFSYTLPSDAKIVSAVIEGTFGNSIFSTSAGVDVYLDNVLVAQCIEFEQNFNDDCVRVGVLILFQRSKVIWFCANILCIQASTKICFYSINLNTRNSLSLNYLYN